ncbi:MAG: molybdenum cofactor guanylyltransferase [Planctomycetota bacterium]|jgi:molybdopterin-guanine dinucleotide biosynthesis protein A
MIRKSKRCDIAGVILAGGNARRIGGVAKGTLKANNGVSIIERLIRELGCAGIDNLVIVANDPEPYQDCGVEIISDIRAGIGPMGGIESGLGHFTACSDAVMFVPCDLPNITAKEMFVLKEAFVESQARAVFAETTGFFYHPLCAVVHNGLSNEVAAAIDRGERKIRNVWRQVKAVRVFFDDETAFLNINTLTDMDKWRRTDNEKANLR